jgi:hypothetical protein
VERVVRLEQLVQVALASGRRDRSRELRVQLLQSRDEGSTRVRGLLRERAHGDALERCRDVIELDHLRTLQRRHDEASAARRGGRHEKPVAMQAVERLPRRRPGDAEPFGHAHLRDVRAGQEPPSNDQRLQPVVHVGGT